MAENRAALRTIAGRVHREAVAGPLPPATAPTETLIERATDGMGALRYAVPAGTRITGPDPRDGRGQYWVVTAGSLTHGGEALPKLSCIFVYPDDAPFEAVAGAEGVEVIAMQFPLHATGRTH